MKRILRAFLASMVGVVLFISPVFAQDWRKTFEAATEDYLKHMPYEWTTSITPKAKIDGVYFKFQDRAATPLINIFLDSNKGATYDALLSTAYMVNFSAAAGTTGSQYYFWNPSHDLIIEKGDEIRVVIGSNTSLTCATSVGILIKGVRE